MAQSHRERAALLHEEDGDLQQYRAVSRAALLACLLGILSVLVFASLSLLVIPIAATLLAIAALRAIAGSDGALIGRPLAYVGLGLALGCAAAAVGYHTMHRQQLIRDAKGVATLWFELLQQDQPQRAHQLTVDQNVRLPPQRNLWPIYQRNAKLYGRLEKFLGSKLVRTLLALGEEAEVRYFDTEVIESNDMRDMISQVYSVTLDKDGQRTTFFVRVVLERKRDHRTGRDAWVVYNYYGAVRPYQGLN